MLKLPLEIIAIILGYAGELNFVLNKELQQIYKDKYYILTLLHSPYYSANPKLLLYRASRCDKLDYIKVFINILDNIDIIDYISMVSIGIRYNNTQTVKYLLDLNKYTDEQLACYLTSSCECGNLELVSHILQMLKDNSVIFINNQDPVKASCMYGRIDILKYLSNTEYIKDYIIEEYYELVMLCTRFGQSDIINYITELKKG